MQPQCLSPGSGLHHEWWLVWLHRSSPSLLDQREKYQVESGKPAGACLPVAGLLSQSWQGGQLKDTFSRSALTPAISIFNLPTASNPLSPRLHSSIFFFLHARISGVNPHCSPFSQCSFLLPRIFFLNDEPWEENSEYSVWVGPPFSVGIMLAAGLNNKISWLNLIHPLFTGQLNAD